MSTSVSQLNEESQKLCKDLEELSSANKKLNTLNNLKGKLTNKLTTYKKQHEFFEENDTCPTCSQSITKEVREHKAGVIRSQVKELVLAIEELRCNMLDEQERCESIQRSLKS